MGQLRRRSDRTHGDRLITSKLPPRIDLSELESRGSPSPLTPDFLGVTIDSWQEQIRSKGPVMLAQVAGKEQLILCNHETDRRAWKAPDDWLYGPPTTSGDFFYREMGTTHITQQDGDVHKRSRKLLLPGFGIAAIGRDINTLGDTLSSGLSAINNRAQNLHEELCVIYARALSRTQVKVGLSEEQLRNLTHFEEHFISGLQLSADDQLRWHSHPDYVRSKADAFALFDRIAEDRRNGRKEDDTLQSLLDSDKNADLTPLQDAELKNVIYLLLVAGVGNIAVLAACMLWSLHQRPDWREQLEQELALFTPESIQRGLKQYPKLMATILETERLFLPAPVVPKITTKDLDVLGFHVPANTHVLQMIGMSHFDEARYPEAGQFKPERWLQGDTARANAYGGGIHLCLGMGVSRTLLPLTLSSLVLNHRVEDITEPKTAKVDPTLDYSPSTTKMTVTLTGK